MFKAVAWECSALPGDGISSSNGSSGGSGGDGSSCGGAHVPPVRSALQYTLVLAFWSVTSCSGFALGQARSLLAAADIASDPECEAAIDSRLAELAANQPAHYTPLRLTARQLRCTWYRLLVNIHAIHAIKPSLPAPNDSTGQLPMPSMPAAEMRAQLLAAVQAGVDSLLQLEPYAACTLLVRATNESLLQPAPAGALERCLNALAAARREGSRISQVNAGSCCIFCALHDLSLGGAAGFD